MKLLLDTSAMLALIWKKDRNHDAARKFVRANPGAKWVMSDLLVAEVATRVRARESAARAAKVARSITLALADVVYADPDLMDAALRVLERYADKQLSLADCLSFVLIDRIGLDGAFTFDRDFRDCGFRALP